MKRLFALALILLTICFSLAASQLLYRSDSYEVKTFKSLKRMAGDNSVEPSYPVSGSQLLVLVENIPQNNLDEKAIKSLESLKRTLQGDASSTYDYEITVGAETYWRESEDKISYDGLFLPLKDRNYMYGVNGKLFWNQNACGVFNLQFTRAWTEEEYNRNFFLALPMMDHDERQPWEEYVSIGNKNINFFVGRNRFSAGNGRINNMFMGDNFKYEEGAKLSLINSVFSYDLTLLTFNPETGLNHVKSAFDFNSQNLLIANHRFSMVLFDAISFNLYEAMLEYGINAFDLRMLNPFMIMHNVGSWAYGNNNNLFGVELSANLGRGFELNIQTMFDQIQGSNELYALSTDELPPNSGAVMVNLVYSKPSENGVFDFWVEGVYTSPGCYIKEQFPKFSHDFTWYQVDWLLGIKSGDETEFNYLGYKYGPNCIGANIGASYVSKKASIEGTLDYHFTGTYKKGDFINTESRYFYKYFPYCIGEGKVFEHDIIAGIKASYEPLKWIRIQGSLAYLHSINKDNIEGNSFSDVQGSLGITVDLAGLVKSII